MRKGPIYRTFLVFPDATHKTGMFGLMLLRVNPCTPIAFGRQKKRIVDHPKTINLHGLICLTDFFHWTIHSHMALFDPNGLLAHAFHLIDVVGNE